MQAREQDRREWLVILLILLIGLPCILLAGGWALRFNPNWKLNANMESNLDPNSDFLTKRPFLINQLDPDILTKPAGYDIFLTPSAQFSTGTRPPITTETSFPTRTTTPVPSRTVPAASASPTRTTIFIPTLPNPTSTRTPTSVSVSTPTDTHTPTATPTPSFTPTATFTPTFTTVPSADLQITKTDDATHYASNSMKTYTIIVSNPVGPSAINGATVTDIFPAQITSAVWSCAGAGGATCTANGAGNINDDSVNLPVGSSVTYTVNATIGGGATGDLVNSASVSLPMGYTDPVPGNNIATDTDTLITTDTTPGQVGTTPDSNVYNLGAGGTLTLNIDITVNGNPGWDLVYYERPAGSGILMDWVIIEISDGQNWYTVLNWYNNVADTNTNVDFNILPIPVMPPIPPPQEPDQRDIPSANLYNSTGVAINLDGVVPPGIYSFIRIYAPPGDADGQLEIDALEVLP